MEKSETGNPECIPGQDPCSEVLGHLVDAHQESYSPVLSKALDGQHRFGQSRELTPEEETETRMEGLPEVDPLENKGPLEVPGPLNDRPPISEVSTDPPALSKGNEVADPVGLDPLRLPASKTKRLREVDHIDVPSLPQRLDERGIKRVNLRVLGEEANLCRSSCENPRPAVKEREEAAEENTGQRE